MYGLCAQVLEHQFCFLFVLLGWFPHVRCCVIGPSIVASPLKQSRNRLMPTLPAAFPGCPNIKVDGLWLFRPPGYITFAPWAHLCNCMGFMPKSLSCNYVCYLFYWAGSHLPLPYVGSLEGLMQHHEGQSNCCLFGTCFVPKTSLI